MEICSVCNGSGDCRVCHGRGKWRGMIPGEPDDPVDCNECKGSGKCANCSGKCHPEDISDKKY